MSINIQNKQLNETENHHYDHHRTHFFLHTKQCIRAQPDIINYLLELQTNEPNSSRKYYVNERRRMEHGFIKLVFCFSHKLSSEILALI